MPDAQAAYESAQTLLRRPCRAGTNFVLHGAGWLKAALASGYEKFVMDADQPRHDAACWPRASISPRTAKPSRRSAKSAPGSHYLGCSHTQANFETAFYRSSIADNNSYEQWLAEGEQDAAQRANKIWKRMLNGIRGSRRSTPRGSTKRCRAFLTKRKAAAPDSNV